MHTLIAHYLPRGERSRTRRLLDAFLQEHDGGSIELLDLALHPPAALDSESLPAYARRNYAEETLTDGETKALAVADALCEQVRRADAVVLAFPMFNFSVPAAVKAWMDAVMQKGRTWTMRDGMATGLMTGKQALILMTSGGLYEGERASWDHAAPLARHAFEFMGFSDIRLIRADGMNADPAGAEVRITEAQNAVRRVALEWFTETASTATIR